MSYSRDRIGLFPMPLLSVLRHTLQVPATNGWFVSNFIIVSPSLFRQSTATSYSNQSASLAVHYNNHLVFVSPLYWSLRDYFILLFSSTIKSYHKIITFLFYATTISFFLFWMTLNSTIASVSPLYCTQSTSCCFNLPHSTQLTFLDTTHTIQHYNNNYKTRQCRSRIQLCPRRGPGNGSPTIAGPFQAGTRRTIQHERQWYWWTASWQQQP